MLLKLVCSAASVYLCARAHSCSLAWATIWICTVCLVGKFIWVRYLQILGPSVVLVYCLYVRKYKYCLCFQIRVLFRSLTCVCLDMCVSYLCCCCCCCRPSSVRFRSAWPSWSSSTNSTVAWPGRTALTRPANSGKWCMMGTGDGITCRGGWPPSYADSR